LDFRVSSPSKASAGGQELHPWEVYSSITAGRGLAAAPTVEHARAAAIRHAYGSLDMELSLAMRKKTGSRPGRLHALGAARLRSKGAVAPPL